MTLNRLVALLTPLVFAPLAGVVSTWAAKNLPGVDLPPDKLEQIFIAGALIALAPAAQWLHGWQKYEQRQDEAASFYEEILRSDPLDREAFAFLDSYYRRKQRHSSRAELLEQSGSNTAVPLRVRITRLVRAPLAPLGELRGVIYRASRAPGAEPKNYVHFFQQRLPVLAVDPTGLAEDFEVVRDGGLADVAARREVACADLRPIAELAKDRESRRVRRRLEKADIRVGLPFHAT